MPEYLPALLIVTGVLLLVTGLCYKTLKVSAAWKDKFSNRTTLLSILEQITNRKIIRKLLDYLSRNRFLPNKSTTRLLELSEAGISIQQLYLLKAICFFLCIGLVFIIGYSNYSYEVKRIIATSDTQDSIFYQKDKPDDSKYELFRQISREVDVDKLNKYGYSEKYNQVELIVSIYLNTDNKQILKENTEWFLNTLEKVNNLRRVRLEYIIIAFLALLIPENFLIIRWIVRGSIYKREIIKLEYIFDLLARVEGIKTMDIIQELGKSSKIYSKYFQEFLYLFRYDKKRGFDYLKSRNIKSLTSIANVLEVYSLSDREIALQIMERGVMERDEAIMLTADENMDIIDLAAFLSIAPLVYELARLMLDPMLDMVYKAFEFI